MSQLIKKLKATQSQNTFVTPEAAAKIISSSGRKSKRNYRTFWSIVLMTIMGIGGCCFWGIKKRPIWWFWIRKHWGYALHEASENDEIGRGELRGALPRNPT